MRMLIEELAGLASDPLAWGAILLLAPYAFYSLLHWRACRLLNAPRASRPGAISATAICASLRLNCRAMKRARLRSNGCVRRIAGRSPCIFSC